MMVVVIRWSFLVRFFLVLLTVANGLFICVSGDLSEHGSAVCSFQISLGSANVNASTGIESAWRRLPAGSGSGSTVDTDGDYFTDALLEAQIRSRKPAESLSDDIGKGQACVSCCGGDATTQRNTERVEPDRKTEYDERIPRSRNLEGAPDATPKGEPQEPIKLDVESVVGEWIVRFNEYAMAEVHRERMERELLRVLGIESCGHHTQVTSTDEGSSAVPHESHPHTGCGSCVPCVFGNKHTAIEDRGRCNGAPLVGRLGELRTCQPCQNSSFALRSTDIEDQCSTTTINSSLTAAERCRRSSSALESTLASENGGLAPQMHDSHLRCPELVERLDRGRDHTGEHSRIGTGRCSAHCCEHEHGHEDSLETPTFKSVAAFHRHSCSHPALKERQGSYKGTPTEARDVHIAAATATGVCITACCCNGQPERPFLQQKQQQHQHQQQCPWTWVQRRNPAMAFPTDFGVMAFQGEQVRRAVEGLGFVKDVHPQKRLTRRLMWGERGEEEEEEGGGESAEGGTFDDEDWLGDVRKRPGRWQTKMSLEDHELVGIHAHGGKHHGSSRPEGDDDDKHAAQADGQSGTDDAEVENEAEYSFGRELRWERGDGGEAGKPASRLGGEGAQTRELHPSRHSGRLRSSSGREQQEGAGLGTGQQGRGGSAAVGDGERWRDDGDALWFAAQLPAGGTAARGAAGDAGAHEGRIREREREGQASRERERERRRRLLQVRGQGGVSEGVGDGTI